MCVCVRRCACARVCTLVYILYEDTKKVMRYVCVFLNKQTDRQTDRWRGKEKKEKQIIKQRQRKRKKERKKERYKTDVRCFSFRTRSFQVSQFSDYAR